MQDPADALGLDFDPATMPEVAYWEREVRAQHHTVDLLRAKGTERATQIGTLLNNLANARKHLDEARGRAKSEIEADNIQGLRDPAQILRKLAEYAATLVAVCPEAVADLQAAFTAAQAATSGDR